MAMTRQSFKNDCIILNTLNDLVPQEHLVRKLDNCLIFSFIEDLVKDLQPSWKTKYSFYGAF